MKPEIYILYITALKNNISFYNLILMRYGDEQDKLTYELLVLSSYINGNSPITSANDILLLADKFSDFIENILPDTYYLHIKKLLKQMPK